MIRPGIKFYPVDQDLDDQRDVLYTPVDVEIKEAVDLRQWASAVENQANLRSCTSQAVVGAFELLLKKLYPEKFIDLSPLFVYYNAKVLEGKKEIYDPGVYVRDALKAVKLQGICAEKVWPYDLKTFSATPNLDSYRDASKRKIKNYYRCSTIDDILNALCNEMPVVVGMRIYYNFQWLGWNGSTEILSPKNNEILIGGHSIVLVGYDKSTGMFTARNSFGPLWADKGYFYIPFDYAEQEFMDSWVFDIEVE